MTQASADIRSKEIIRDIVRQLADSNRNLVSDEFEESLDYLRKYFDLTVLRYKTNTPCWTWSVPPKWRVKDAYIKHEGKEIVSFKNHPLHVMSYSIPVDREMKGKDLLENIFVHSLREAIPYEFSFYKRRWGFCLTHEQKRQIKEDETYQVRIDSELVDDYLSVGDYTIPGTSDEHIFFLSHIDHPYQVNDGLIGAAVHVALAIRLLDNNRRYYNYTFLFVPETIGSIAYLSHHEDLIPKIRYAVFVEMVGFDNPLILQKSYREPALINDYALYALKKQQGKSQGYPFLTVAGNDEKIFDSPGVGIPAISVTRVDQDERVRLNRERRARGEYKLIPPYPQYHTHLDNVGLVNIDRVAETVQYLHELVNILEGDFVPIRKFKGPIFLSRYDLWVDWRTDLEMNEKMLWLMYLLEGEMTAFQIARKLDIEFEKVVSILHRMHEEGLIEKRRIHVGFDR